MKLKVEEVYKTEGVPVYTFVTIGIKFHPSGDLSKLNDEVTDQVTFKLHKRL
jgi:hypothetical protein